MEIPAISVIIPMYNVEKYISDCLNSLLAQTFQDFEVIVADDCSTDNSVEIVKNYAPKFNGRLKLTKTKENSGGGGYVPRNLGLGLSRGNYIFFVDSDDFITKTALEELHNAAKISDAEVVYTASYYLYKNAKEVVLERDNEGNLLIQKNIEYKPTLIVNSPEKSLQKLLVEGHFRNPWTKFVRREFLFENEIAFPKIIQGGDFIWVIQVYCHAKRFLRIPNAVYCYRDYSAESVTRKKRTATEQNFYWVSAFVSWLKALEKLSNRAEILHKNPDYCYVAALQHFNYCLGRFFEERMQLSSKDIYKTLHSEFSKRNAVSDLTLPFFFSVIDSQQKNLIITQQRVNQFAAQTQARIAELENEIKRLKGVNSASE